MVQILDEIDLKILRALQENCRLTNKELAAKIHLSTTPTFERQKRLERLGYIRQYVAVIDAEMMERGFVVYCNVSMTHTNAEVAALFKAQLEEWNEVSECYNVSGDCDYMMKVYVKSMDEYQRFVIEKVGSLDYVSRIQSVFVMDTLKMTYGIPL